MPKKSRKVTVSLYHASAKDSQDIVHVHVNMMMNKTSPTEVLGSVALPAATHRFAKSRLGCRTPP